MKKLLVPVTLAALLSSILTLGAASLFLRERYKQSTKERIKTVEVVKRVSANNTPPPRTVLLPGKRGNLPDFVPLVNQLKPAVVHIATSSGMGNPYLLKRYRGRNTGSLGTGIIISPDGMIVTNYHVIKGATRIQVTLSGGKTYPAYLKGRDPLTDVALIKIDGHNLPVARLGNSDALPIGSWVIAIGNPFGLSNTVTAGIVSAKNRTDLTPGRFDYSSYIQTDTAINPGNSGGPLINLSGEVVGINTLVDVRGQGIGYAIPINRVKRILPHLAKWGKVASSFLGVQVIEVNPQIMRKTKFPKNEGVYVDSVTYGGPAYKAGLKAGDIITKFNGKPIRSEQDIAWEARVAGIGKRVKIVIYRDYKYREISVVMTSYPGSSATKALPSRSGTPPPFGLYVRDRSAGGYKSRVTVVRVGPGSVGAKYGIKRGDRILNVGKTPVESVKEYLNALRGYAQGQNVMLLIDSPHTTRWVVLPKD